MEGKAKERSVKFVVSSIWLVMALILVSGCTSEKAQETQVTEALTSVAESLEEKNSAAGASGETIASGSKREEALSKTGETEVSSERSLPVLSGEKAIQILCDKESLDASKVLDYEIAVGTWKEKEACSLNLEYGDCQYEAWLDLESGDVLDCYHVDAATGEHGNSSWEQEVKAMRCSCGGEYIIADTAYGEWKKNGEEACSHDLSGTDVKSTRDVEAQLQCSACGKTTAYQGSGEKNECRGYAQ